MGASNSETNLVRFQNLRWYLIANAHRDKLTQKQKQMHIIAQDKLKI